MDTPPSSPEKPSAPSPATHPARRRSPLFLGCTALLVLALVVVLTVSITLWWIQRPIVPVVLDAPEQVVLDAKIDRLAAPAKDTPAIPATQPAAPPTITDDSGQPPVRMDPPYQPGDRTLRITERELNALLNQNTDLGQSVRLELGQDAINAYMAIPLPEDFPIGGGKTFRAKARFKVSIGQGQPPMAVIEDVSVLGLSLPKAWLGDLKGQNLLGDTMVDRQGNPLANGIKTLRVEPGQLVLEVEE